MRREGSAAHTGQARLFHDFFHRFSRQFRNAFPAERQGISFVRLDLDGRDRAPQGVAGRIDFNDRSVYRAVHRCGDEASRLAYHLAPRNMVALGHHGLAGSADMLGQRNEQSFRQRHSRYREIGRQGLEIRRMHSPFEFEDFHSGK